MAVPSTIQDVLASPFAAEWQAAINSHLKDLDDREVWQWVESVPAGATVYASTWRFDYELDALGDVMWRTAEVVAVDPSAEKDSSKEGDALIPTSAPLSLFRSLRILLAIAATESQQLCHIRLPFAHFGDDLSETIYVQAPPGTNETSEGGAYRLIKPLPGLAGTSNAADSHIAEGLEELGFEPLESDPAVYARNMDSTHPTVVLTHGCELLVVAPTTLEVNDVLIDLQFYHGKDDVMNWGYPRHFLGLKIDNHHASRQIWISQPGLLRRLYSAFPEVKALPDTYTAPEEDHAYDSLALERYTALVDALAHIAATCRPDISLWVSALQQEAHAGGTPSHHDRASALTLLSHLRKSKLTSLSFGGRHDRAPQWSDAEPLAVYAHAAALVGNECWQWGDVVHLLGSTVAWDSQRCTASTRIQDAELVGQHSALRQAEGITHFLTQLGYARFTSAVIPIRACSTHVGPDSDELEPLPVTPPTRPAPLADHCVDTSSTAIADRVQQRSVRFVPPQPYAIGSTAPSLQYAEYMARLVDRARDDDDRTYRYWAMQLGVVEPRPPGNNLKKVLEGLRGLELEYTTDSVAG